MVKMFICLQRQKEQTTLLKDFNQANGYLISKFAEVVTQIEQLQVVTNA